MMPTVFILQDYWMIYFMEKNNILKLVIIELIFGLETLLMIKYLDLKK